MKVSDAMSHQVDYVSVNAKLKDVAKLIFGSGINGVPVCEQKKVVGFIAESDILKQFFPSIREFVEEPLLSGDFEAMEKKVEEILNLPAEKIMSKNPVTISADTPLMKAQSLMMLKDVGRLPVVNSEGVLIGIIATGDIFRFAVGDQIPLSSDEEYHDWLAKHYDLVVKWGERLGNEVPDLTKLFEKEGVKKILDVGFGTGEHDIALAKKGFEVLGLEKSRRMERTAKLKTLALPDAVTKRVSFMKGEYDELLKERRGEFDAAIFMGNALSHTAEDLKKVLAATSAALKPHSLMVLQIVNYEKVFKVNQGLVAFNSAKSKYGPEREHAFLEFYNPFRKPTDLLTLNMQILNFDGKRWKPRAMNSAKIAYLNQELIEKLLKQNGFKDIRFYGSKNLGHLFRHNFYPLESDWLNVIAEK